VRRRAGIATARREIGALSSISGRPQLRTSSDAISTAQGPWNAHDSRDIASRHAAVARTDHWRTRFRCVADVSRNSGFRRRLWRFIDARGSQGPGIGRRRAVWAGDRGAGLAARASDVQERTTAGLRLCRAAEAATLSWPPSCRRSCPGERSAAHGFRKAPSSSGTGRHRSDRASLSDGRPAGGHTHCAVRNSRCRPYISWRTCNGGTRGRCPPPITPMRQRRVGP
jgi:hypothetical protein